jgi:cell division protein FtsQ
VATKGNNKTRSLPWEDEAPVESRFRRVGQSVPLSGRGLPGMPLEIEDLDDDEHRSSRRERFGAQRNPWWRPRSTWARVSLGLGALAVVSSLAVSVHLLKNFLDRDPRFRIAGTSNIQATGLIEVSRADMLPVFGEDVGRNIFFVPLAERRKQLEQIPWVQQATVMRLLPDQIRVSVVERQPVAFVRHGQQIGLVDANGVLLDMPAAAMAQHHYSFPVVTGIDAGDPLPSRKTRMAVYQRLLGELDANGQHDSDQVSEIDLTDPEDARVLMPEQGTDILAHFGEDHFLDRYQRYKAHIAEWRQQYPKLAEVDLRYDQQVVLEMTPGSATNQTAVNTGNVKPAAGEPATPPVQADVAPPAHAPVKHAATAKPVKAHTNSSSKASVVAMAEKMKARRRAEAKRAELNRSRQKTAKTRPAANARQGQ